ncbi:MAG: aromatic ring-hydroxylating dioxygenase subunit alpha [Armatimonadetes bacterium]|nr:aromatic ring-hydroxylating dioxygenase subunit alpha [Armatimonadota bacterium]
MHYEVDPDITVASTLPGSFYHDPEVYEAAKNSVFAKSWQFIGDTDSVKVPGSTLPFTLLDGLLDEPLLLSRDMDDKLRCLSNVCTHRGMLVCEHGGNERFLRCRYHGRRFGMDGKFQSMPEFETCQNFPTTGDDLTEVPLGSWSKLLFTSLDPICDLEEYLKPVIDRVGWLPLHEFSFTPTRSRDYLIHANWALYCENYLEGFHIPFIHADLNSVIDYGQYTTEMFDYCNLQLGVSSGGESCFNLPATSPDFGRDISAYYFWVFPNLMLNFYPWGLSVNVVSPLGPELTKVKFLCYVWDESKIGQGAGAALDRVEREDEVVVELVQKGIKSRFYDRGRFSPTKEQGTHHFQSLLLQFLQSEPKV